MTSSPRSAADRRRLDSWKEVAAYLDRDVRTVMRWETSRGMPVHRVPGAHKGRSVFAFADELDSWLRSDGDGGHGVAPATVGSANGLLGAASLAAATVVVAMTWSATENGPDDVAESRRVAGSEISAGALVALDAAGRSLWTFRPDGGRTFSNMDPEVRLFDLDGDGDDEIVLSTNTTRPGGHRADHRAELFGLSPVGDLLWHRVRDDEVRFGAASFAPPWVAERAMIRRIDGSPRILWLLHHYTMWPGILVVLSSDGQIVGEFVNSGWIETAEIFDTPGGEVLLAGGISNSRAAAALAVLDARDPSGASPEEPTSEFACLSCPSGEPLRYFVFPRTEVNRFSELPYNAVTSMVPHAETIDVAVHEGFARIHWLYELSSDLEPLRATPADAYWVQHRDLRLDGKIDHLEEDCPERDGVSVRAWAPESGWREVRLPVVVTGS